MKTVVRSLCCIGLLLGLTSFVSAADQTWTGKISDSMCGGSHAKMIAAHGGAGKMTDRDCTLACTKAGGKYVFVMGGSGKVYNIANQDLADLADTCRAHSKAYRRDEGRHHHSLKNRHARARENIGRNAGCVREKTPLSQVGSTSRRSLHRGNLLSFSPSSTGSRASRRSLISRTTFEEVGVR